MRNARGPALCPAPLAGSDAVETLRGEAYGPWQQMDGAWAIISRYILLYPEITRRWREMRIAGVGKELRTIAHSL